MRLRPVLLFATLALTACSSTEFPPARQPVDYARFAVRLNAASVEVVNDYQPRGSAPNIDHLMDYPPAQAISDWSHQALTAQGASGYVQVHIKDASVVTRQLGKIGGVEGYFTKEQAEELVAHVSVEINGDQRDQKFQGSVTVEASALQTVPEDASPAVRKGIERQLVDKLMEQFAGKAQLGIRQHLGPLVAG